MDGPLKLVDLKTVYFQLKVKEPLWQYQQVQVFGQRWVLTRVGFGLASGPRIMSAIVKKVLS